MNTVVFGQYDSYADLNLLLTEKKIGTPDPKTELIDIPGGDGVIDLTEFFDGTKYKNRQLSFEFATIVHRSLFMQQFTMVQNLLHGKKMRIQPSDDDWYYTGRVSVNDWTADRSIGRFSVDCDCEPYKHRDRVQAVHLGGKNLLDLSNFEQGVLNAQLGKTWGELTVSTTKNRLRSKYPMPIKPNTQYTLSFPNSTFRIASRQFDKDNKLIAFGGWYTNTTTIQTLPDTQTIAIYIAFSNDATITQADISGLAFQLEEGGTATAFEQFGASQQTITATFDNLNRAAVPTIYATSSLYVENGHNAATLSPGDNTLPDFAFYAGTNTLTFKGSGSALVRWTEGAL